MMKCVEMIDEDLMLVDDVILITIIWQLDINLIETAVIAFELIVTNFDKWQLWYEVTAIDDTRKVDSFNLIMT